jgi:hypothetical protein
MTGVRLGDQEGFGVFLGDGEEFEGGLAGAAGALFPTADGVGADVEVCGEERLAGVQRLADVADFFGGNGFGARDAQVDGLAAFVGGGILQSLLHAVEDVHFDFLGHFQPPASRFNLPQDFFEPITAP